MSLIGEVSLYGKLVQDHIACYYVEYEGKRIRPLAAKRLHMPLNEIWISETFREREERILFHELQEIKYRRKGYSGKKAHQKARKDEEMLFGER